MPDSENGITVSVTLRSILGKFRPNPKDRKPFAVRLDEGGTVADLIEALRVPDKLAKLIFVDHVRSDRSVVLSEGSAIDIFPPIAGG